jgi:hypothetical protein
MSPFRKRSVKWCSGTRDVDPSPLSRGIMDFESMRLWRRGFETRIESNWDVVGVGEVFSNVSHRVVRDVVCNLKCSQDKI